jgi:release factor glutamine methyltransferase
MNWTIKKLLEWNTDYFTKNGIESARLEAEVLIAFSLDLRRLDLYLKFDQPVSDEELQKLKALIKRRVAHEPMAYIVGKKEFWSRDFYVNKDVLVPRPDTEVLVQTVLDEFESLGSLKGLEVGLGSGCIAITLLSELVDLKMNAVEISPEAVAIAGKNATYHGVNKRLAVKQEDFLKSALAQAESAQYGFIVSNPPYVAATELDSLAPTVKDFEPIKLALLADDNGLAYYPVLASYAKQHLKEGGLLAVEVGDTQAKAVSEIFKDKGLSNIQIKKDLAGHERVVCGSISS